MFRKYLVSSIMFNSGLLTLYFPVFYSKRVVYAFQKLVTSVILDTT